MGHIEPSFVQSKCLPEGSYCPPACHIPAPSNCTNGDIVCDMGSTADGCWLGDYCMPAGSECPPPTAMWSGILSVLHFSLTFSTNIKYIHTINQHLEKVATGEFKCKLCGKEAKRSIDMKRHIETHLEGLSYPCQVCGKTFRSRNSLNTHRVNSHRK